MLSVRTLLAVGLSAFLLFVIILFPAGMGARMVTTDADISYGSVSGSLWDMTLEDTYWNGVPIGQMTLKPNVFSSLFGAPSGSLAFQNDIHRGAVAELVVGEKIQLKQFSLITEVKGQFGPMLLSGPLSAQGDLLVLDASGLCTAGGFNFRTNILETILQGDGANAPLIQGTAKCTPDGMQIAFAGISEQVQINGSGIWRGDRQLQTEVILAFKHDADIPNSLKSAMEFAGLLETDDGWRGQLSLDLY